MIYKEASATVKHRFARRKACPICGEPIQEYDDFQFCKAKNGRYMLYIFFHNKCLVKHQIL